MSRDFHELTVKQTRVEIGGAARTMMFDLPSALQERFHWRAGQHITLRFEIDGREVRRSYSIASSPVSGDPLRITVKRVRGGLVSNHINDHAAMGNRLDVMPPFGGFCLDTDRLQRRTHYFFGGGSGITPLFAMLHSVLLAEPYSVTHVAYGNRDGASILFRNRLRRLQTEYPDRLSVNHVISSPPMWSGFDYWRKGRIDRAAIEALFAENPPHAQDAQYYVCGPGRMNGAVKGALMELDVPANRIHMESYGGEVDADDSVKGIAAEALIMLEGQKRSVPVAASQTVLDAVRATGLAPPFSCQSGVCGACRARLTEGSVHMRARMALEDDEIARGVVLTCQAVATSGRLAVSFS